MKKKADIYFKIKPWDILESGFDKDHSLICESIFSLGNEYMGVRGYFEEGFSGKTLIGSYINGVYERKYLGKSGYKGIIDSTEFMINTVDFLYTRISCNGIILDLNHSTIRDFKRNLNMKTGVLTRSFIWEIEDNTEIYIEFERFLSMENPKFGGQKISFKCLKGLASLNIKCGLDFSRKHMLMDENFWNCPKDTMIIHSNYCEIMGITKTTFQKVLASCYFKTEFMQTSLVEKNEKSLFLNYKGILDEGKASDITRLIHISYDKYDDHLEKWEDLSKIDYEDLKEKSASWWKNSWKLSDIEIEEDDMIQQGIRYSIFQLNQTLHTSDYGAIIGAKGLTGEVYNGNAFWDSEVYCLPFYIFTNPTAARSILKFRYDTLSKAKKRAKDLDCNGAFYPIATISGDECCSLWQHASTQLQASTGVMYGISQYINSTLDYDFLYDYGVEMLIEISRMLATRGDFNPLTGKYGFYGVMGPDEFQVMVNNNCYTNFMAKKTFEYTEYSLIKMEKESIDKFKKLLEKTSLKEKERENWIYMSENMYIPYDEDTMLFEEQDGFYSLPKIDIKKIPKEDFPLYHNWSYDRIYRNNMIKQPDVLMFMFLYNSDFTKKQIEANYKYYEPLCIHESSLSPSVHSILAAQVKKEEDVYRFFNFATRLDLDNYNRNTNEGLHITSFAGAWMNIVYGFSGFRSDGENLSFAPIIFNDFNRYSFNILYHGAVIHVNITKAFAEFSSDKSVKMPINIYGKSYFLNGDTITIPLGDKI